jgi:hypothetical protein
VGVLAGALLAAGSGWLYGASRAPAAAASPAVPHPGHRPLPMIPPAADLAVRNGVLEIPVVDTLEVLPTCHN